MTITFFWPPAFPFFVVTLLALVMYALLHGHTLIDRDMERQERARLRKIEASLRRDL